LAYLREAVYLLLILVTNVVASRHFISVHFSKSHHLSRIWSLHGKICSETALGGRFSARCNSSEWWNGPVNHGQLFCELHIWKRSSKKLSKALNIAFAIVISSFTVTKHKCEHVHLGQGAV